MKKLLCLILSVLLGLCACSEVTEAAPPQTIPSQQTEAPPTQQTEVPTVPTESLPPETEPEEDPTLPRVINILLIGQDRREGEERSRSDSMILVTFNRSNDTITMTSFMRDALVQIPGYDASKLNHAYQYGGMELLNETLLVNYGVAVDGDVEVDLAQFQGLIDMLGGVDIELTEAEAEYLAQWQGWELTAGPNRLTGAQALAYARIRYIDNDYRRAQRQRNLLLALMERYRTLPLTQVLTMLEDSMDMVTTNMEKARIAGLAVTLFPMLSTAAFQTQQIPAPGTFREGSPPGYEDWFQYDIDFETNRQLLAALFATQ